MSFGSFSFARSYMYVPCVSSAVNTQSFVWKFFSSIYKFSFIHLYTLCVSSAVNTQGFVRKFFHAPYINFDSFIHSCCTNAECKYRTDIHCVSFLRLACTVSILSGLLPNKQSGFRGCKNAESIITLSATSV